MKLVLTKTLSKSLDSPAICSADTWKPSNSVYRFWKFEHDFFPFCCKLEQFKNASIKAFTLTDFGKQLEWDIQQIMFFLVFQIQLILIKVSSDAIFVNSWFFFLSLLTCVRNRRGSLYKARLSWVYLVSFSRFQFSNDELIFSYLWGKSIYLEQF